MSETTTIAIQTSTRDKLKKIGEKGETYDSIINELLVLRDAVGGIGE